MGTPSYMADRIAHLRAAESSIGRVDAPVTATVNLPAVVSDDDAVIARERERTEAATFAPQSQSRRAMPDEGRGATGMYIGRPEQFAAELTRYESAGVEHAILTL